MAEPIMNVA